MLAPLLRPSCLNLSDRASEEKAKPRSLPEVRRAPSKHLFSSKVASQANPAACIVAASGSIGNVVAHDSKAGQPDETRPTNAVYASVPSKRGLCTWRRHVESSLRQLEGKVGSGSMGKVSLCRVLEFSTASRSFVGTPQSGPRL